MVELPQEIVGAALTLQSGTHSSRQTNKQQGFRLCKQTHNAFLAGVMLHHLQKLKEQVRKRHRLQNTMVMYCQLPHLVQLCRCRKSQCCSRCLVSASALVPTISATSACLHEHEHFAKSPSAVCGTSMHLCSLSSPPASPELPCAARPRPSVPSSVCVSWSDGLALGKQHRGSALLQPSLLQLRPRRVVFSMSLPAICSKSWVSCSGLREATFSISPCIHSISRCKWSYAGCDRFLHATMYAGQPHSSAAGVVLWAAITLSGNTGPIRHQCPMLVKTMCWHCCATLSRHAQTRWCRGRLLT